MGSVAIASFIAVAMGVGFIYYKRSHPRVYTEPIIQVQPSYEADVSTLQNMIGAVNALEKQYGAI